ncbi:helix-turn-helix domain-containing protein [Bradyrhizobium tropiciagri]|uniref:helix-turn-helix domain-containing protein n=1 Tax=Bradyrhizobium tropiciagri TaxID=312253 RepID=UPI00067B628D|nr:helix-turn-helix transcriptional regulator [Bradyrhizobium tropiciagri]
MRERRLHKSWTQYDPADETGLRQALVSEIEAGKASPTRLSLHKIASALGIQVAELVLPQGTAFAQGAKSAVRRPTKKRRGHPLKPPSH